MTEKEKEEVFKLLALNAEEYIRHLASTMDYVIIKRKYKKHKNRAAIIKYFMIVTEKVT